MKSIIFIASLFLLSAFSAIAQLPSQPDQTTYGIAQLINDKAKQFKLGAVHSESAKMRPTVGKGGYFLRYEKGWVYYNPKLNKAFAIWGDIMKRWSEVGFENGWLGFPTTDHTPTPNRAGFFVAFDNGSIYHSQHYGTHFVAGAFREEWAKRGYENGLTLGFPKTDELEIFISGYTRYQQFEKGTLFFGINQPVLYSDNPNAVNPNVVNTSGYELKFTPKNLTGWEGTISVDDGIDLYGWMDIRVFKTDKAEAKDIDQKSFSLFNIDKARYMPNAVSLTTNDLNFNSTNESFIRRYMISQTEIDAGAFIRITYWLNDQDSSSSNDYLNLQLDNGKWNYNGGNHRYREIKLSELVRNANSIEKMDRLTDGQGDEVNVSYKLSISKK